MSKYDTFLAYPQPSLPSAEAALLTVWPSLSRYHDDLVLVGGLAIHYLTKCDIQGLPGAITMDVDFGISLGASGGQYGKIKSDLAGLGFVPEDLRLVRRRDDIALYIDFLTEDPNRNTLGSRVVDDVIASVVPGINRALDCCRTVAVQGRDVYGADQNCHVRVADIGPLLVLKLNAFGGPSGRRLPKDAYDVLLAVTAFIEGPAAAMKGFWAEEAAGGRAYRIATAVLERDFSKADHDGPIRAAQFLGESGANRDRIRQDLVTVGKRLLGISQHATARIEQSKADPIRSVFDHWAEPEIAEPSSRLTQTSFYRFPFGVRPNNRLLLGVKVFYAKRSPFASWWCSHRYWDELSTSGCCLAIRSDSRRSQCRPFVGLS